jgi:hypothetical protein
MGIGEGHQLLEKVTLELSVVQNLKHALKNERYAPN